MRAQVVELRVFRNLRLASRVKAIDGVNAEEERYQSLGFRVKGLGFRVQGSGFRI